MITIKRGGLRLVVEPPKDKKTPGARRWVLRVTSGGKRYNRGLGPYPLVSPATDIRRAAREGRDLLAEREQARARSVSFRQAFARCSPSGGSRSPTPSTCSSGLRQWKSYVFPRIGDKPVSDVTHADILAILERIWFDKPETARRVLHTRLLRP